MMYLSDHIVKDMFRFLGGDLTIVNEGEHVHLLLRHQITPDGERFVRAFVNDRLEVLRSLPAFVI